MNSSQFLTRFIVLTSLLFVGCTPLSENTAFEGSDVEAQLAAAAHSVERSLHTLAAAQEAYSMTAINTAPLITPKGGMGGTASIDWAGPIEPLLEKVGRMTNYKVKVLGASPAIPVLISISGQNIVLADILKNAGLQAGRRANLVVYPESRIIELRYVPV
ncbi:MAG TPA: type IVB secretion system lipoprotein DotD [Gammaproteobacteria bacterium]|nr:type IVB secretion system lipoprotein DotD [Gammaproteobacteria bacterium]